MSCSSDALIPSSEALAFLLDKATTLPTSQSISISDALDKVLAKDISARVNVPEFANSAMDGYAVCITQEMKPPYTFEITDRITAGTCGKPLSEGHAARIFTGAPVPEHTYAVIAQEECERIDNTIEVYKPIEYLENIRPKANDIRTGDIILERGKRLTPADIALIASVGMDTISVYTPITIGMCFSGDELLEPHETLAPGKIFNSNQYALISMLSRLGVNIINLGIIEDTLGATQEALASLAKQCDVIITTGGVSVGEEDHLKTAVASMGSIDLWSVKMKPGKPLAYGSINLDADTHCHFIGLPGNPVSAIATFSLFIKPLVKKLMGMTEYHNISYPVQIDYSWRKQFRREFVRVRINYETIPPTVSKYHKQGSDVLMSTSWADGFAEMTDETAFSIGDRVQFYPIWQ